MVTSFLSTGPNFQGGRGPWFGATNGEFLAVQGSVQNPANGDAYYWDTATGIPPVGPIPSFRITWETLDAPYVSPTGDANRDGKVDLTDFGTLKANFSTGVDPWTIADFDGDGTVSLGDFAILKRNFGKPQTASVPEPNSCLLLLIGLCCLARNSARLRVGSKLDRHGV